MANQQFLGKFSITTDTQNFSVGATAVTLTTGRYYIVGYTSESTSQLCEHMQTQIRAIGATQDASTVVYSGSTGLVTITLETAATLTFTDTALATLLGYTSTSYSSATSFVAERQPRYVWRPSRSAWDYPIDLYGSTFWAPRSTSLVGRSANGTTWGVVGDDIYDATLMYGALADTEVLTPRTGTTYVELQQFWLDVVHNTMPIRFYPDRTLNAAASVVEFMWGTDEGDQIGSFTDYIERHTSTFNGLWDVEIPMMKYIASS